MRPDVTTAMNAPAPSIYGRLFWLAFLANVLLTTGNSITFRFAEFVTFLGGNEAAAGEIVSTALMVSFAWRMYLGQTIDRLGVRRIWIYSYLAYLTGCVLLMTTWKLGLQVYAGRSCFAVGIAGMFAASMSHILTLAPPERRTEIISTFGTSGYLGMTCGSYLGDLVFRSLPNSPQLFVVLFGVTLAVGTLHTLLAVFMTWHDIPVPQESSPGLHRVLLRYWPPLVIFVAMMLGVTFAVTMIFLTRFATERGLGGVRSFFTAYAVAAFTLRLAARKWSRTTGRHKLIVWGLGSQAIGFAALTLVHKEWQLVFPALCCGIGHALIFASAVSLGAGAFPEQFRGAGTTATLAAIDGGMILSAPLLGWIIDDYGFTAMLGTVAVLAGSAAVFYTLATLRVVDSEIIDTHGPSNPA
ncbi:MFS transporter [Planctomicrobium sp. SH664]|uniref:MFS transporter n=1 Tax=Planctomicrobium sp. SH664 TaxID=3448125 RepID=UPI003F5BE2FB